jgi:hypothetical protein
VPLEELLPGLCACDIEAAQCVTVPPVRWVAELFAAFPVICVGVGSPFSGLGLGRRAFLKIATTVSGHISLLGVHHTIAGFTCHYPSCGTLHLGHV